MFKLALLSILLPILCFANSKSDAKHAISLFAPQIFKNKKSPIKTQGCKVDKQKWANLLLTQEPFTENIRFNKYCDIQGKFKVQMDKAFPVNLSIRNYPKYNKLAALITVKIVFEKSVILKILFKETELKGNNQLKFNYTYHATIDPFADKVLQKQTKGELFIHSQDNKNIEKSYQLLF